MTKIYFTLLNNLSYKLWFYIFLILFSFNCATQEESENCLVSYIETDEDVDKSIDDYHSFEYDDKGKLIKEIKLDIVLDGYSKKMEPWVSYYHYDNNDLMIQKDVDISEDGSIDSRYTYDYNEYGLLLSEKFDKNGDGNITRITKYSYNESNDNTKIEIDYSADQTIDEVFDMVYKNNLLLEIQYDSDNDGEYNQLTFYKYNEKGNILTYEFDFRADNSIDDVINYFYNDSDLLVREVRTLSSELTSDYFKYDSYIYYYKYDKKQNLVKKELDNDSDGSIDAVIKFYYNKNNYLIKEEMDSSNDGSIDTVINYSYQCFH